MLAENVTRALQVGNWIGIFPAFNAKTRLFEPRKIRTCIIISIIICTFSASCYGKIASGQAAVSSFMLTEILSILTFACVIWSIYVFNIGSYFANLQKIIDALCSVDMCLMACNVLKIPNINHLALNSSLAVLLTLSIGFLDYYFSHVAEKGLINIYYIHDYLQNIYMLFILMIEAILLVLIRKRLKLFNCLVNDLYREKNVADFLDRADRLTKVHNYICDLVDLFNSAFGIHMLFSVVYNVGNILVSLQMFMYTSDTDRTIIMITAIIWITYCCAQEIFIATMCEKLVDEGKKTITVTYKALFRFSNIAALREKLFILAQQATARCPEFSAAGFFNVNYAMLFTFVNLITTYVIVIIQFNGSKK